MTIPLPWSLSKDDPAGPDLEDRLQEMFDTLAQQFPISGANLANTVLRLAVTGTSRKIAFGVSTGTFGAFLAGTNGTAPNIAHGLAATPLLVIAQITADGGASTIGVNNVWAVGAITYTNTTFDVVAWNNSAFNLTGGTARIAWLAIV